MTYDVLGLRALDYLPCGYGGSRLQFRGPARAVEGRFVCFLGGAATFGRFIERPFPLLTEHLNGVPSLNLGQPTLGVDMLLRDPFIPQAMQRAAVSVLEVPDAINLSNTFYRVHPRRNDRFLGPSQRLCQLYPEIDFARFHFTRHLAEHLRHFDRDRFKLLRKSLQRCWTRKMGQLIARAERPVVLLWLAQGRPPRIARPDAGLFPEFVTEEMLSALSHVLAARVQVIVDAPTGGTAGKLFDPGDERAAGRLPSPQDHETVARALVPVIDRLF